MAVFLSSLTLPYPVESVFAWHEQPEALPALLPLFPRISVLRHEGIRDGAVASLEIRLGPLHILWDARHEGYIPNRQFRDVQIRGPFKRWIHTHQFEPLGDCACRLTDRVEFELRGGRVLNRLAKPFVMWMLSVMFFGRHRQTEQALRDVYALKPCEI